MLCIIFLCTFAMTILRIRRFRWQDLYVLLFCFKEHKQSRRRMHPYFCYIFLSFYTSQNATIHITISQSTIINYNSIGLFQSMITHISK